MKKLKTMILKMIRRLLIWLLDKTQSKQKPNRKFEYTALDGTNFYTVPIGSLHRSRQILFQGIMNKMDLGVDNELLKELLEKIIKNAQAKNFNQVIDTYFRTKRSSVIPSDTSFVCCCVCIVEYVANHYSFTGC